MKRTPLLVRDIERMRTSLTIPAEGRVRVILEGDDGKLRLDLECVACEELLEWDHSKSWWACPVCRQETTELEMGDLLVACYAGLGRVLGYVDEGETRGLDDRKGIGRWVRRLMD